MADKTENVRIQLYINNEKAQAALREMDKEYKQLRASQKKFAAGSEDWKRLQTEIDKVTAKQIAFRKTMDLSSMSLRQLEGYARQLKASFANMVPGTAEFTAASKRIHEVNTRINQLRSNLTPLKNKWQEVGNAMKGVFAGFTLAGIFTAAAAGVKQFLGESIQLAAKAEGIFFAFNKLNNPRLLDNLRKATRGTVSDLDLMKAAVKADNFKIPLDQLGKLFSFAARRAKDTGESVDYLVESIVLGISRKSIPILDNLGLSSQEIQNEFKITGDFAKAVGNIIDREMGKAGEQLDTQAEKLQRLNIFWQNLKITVGDFLLNVLGPASDSMTVMAKNIGKGEGAWDKFKRTLNLINPLLAAQTFAQDQAKEAIKNHNEEMAKANPLFDKWQQNQQSDKTPELTRNVAFLTAEITRLEAELQSETQTVEKNKETILSLNKVREELDVVMGKNIKSVKEEKKAIEDLDKVAQKANAGKLAALGNRFVEELKKRKDFYEEVKLVTMDAEDRELYLAQQKWLKLIELAEKYGIDTTVLVAAMTEETMLIQKKNAQDEIALAEDTAAQVLNKKREAYQEALSAVESFYNQASGIFDSIATVEKNQQDAALQDYIAGNDAKRKSLDERLKNGLLTQKQYDEKMLALDEEQAKKEKEIKVQQWQAQKEAAITQAGMQMALAIARAFADYMYPASLAVAALAGISGAAQIAAISSQPMPAFKDGTDNAPSGWKLVGEEGPELINDSGGYQILSNKDSINLLYSMMASGSKVKQPKNNFDLAPSIARVNAFKNGTISPQSYIQQAQSSVASAGFNYDDSEIKALMREQNKRLESLEITLREKETGISFGGRTGLDKRRQEYEEIQTLSGRK